MIKINPEKAILTVQNKIRAWRDKQFKENDINIQNGLIDNVSITPFVERRDYLRKLPATCESKNLEELKALMIELKII